MRVGLLIYGSLDSVSGGYLYDRKLIQRLLEQGDQVEIFSLPWRNYFSHLRDNFSIPLYRRLLAARLDVLLQDELNHPSLFWMNRRLCKRISYPLVAIVHHLRCSEARPDWQNAFYRQIEQRYLDSVHGFIFNSQTTCQAVNRISPAPRPHVVAYPAGDQFHTNIDPAQIIQRAQQSGPLRLLFVGNLIPRKGLHILLEALKRLPENSITLDVVGSDHIDRIYAEKIRRQVESENLRKQVNFTGALLAHELAKKFMHSHVLVVPSSYEGFGIVYMEGMGFGLPAIATQSGAAREIISDGEDGYLVPVNDFAALADHISTLANNRDRLVKMSLAAHQRFLRHPTWQQSADQIREFLLHFTDVTPEPLRFPHTGLHLTGI